MNCEGRMSFGDFVFPNNPQQISITRSRTVTEQRLMSEDGIVSEYGKGARIISGEGEFFGDDCTAQFARLRERFEKGGGGILYIPSQHPLFAYFRELRMMATDIAGVVRYSFTFVECSDASLRDRSTSIISDGKRSLWDYSYESGIDIWVLLELNPDIRRPDAAVAAGRSIRLC